jgi:hypothetical protein
MKKENHTKSEKNLQSTNQNYQEKFATKGPSSQANRHKRGTTSYYCSKVLIAIKNYENLHKLEVTFLKCSITESALR